MDFRIVTASHILQDEYDYLPDVARSLAAAAYVANPDLAPRELAKLAAEEDESQRYPVEAK